MDDSSDAPGREQAKRGRAEQLADRAFEARQGGAEETARQADDEALRTDPEGLANRLEAERDDAASGPSGVDATDDASDEAVHAITGTVEPGSDAPSRAGISGSGSGADNM